MNPNVKRQEKSSCEDKISTLTDDVLSHILSFLPTKYAVATSILSKRWKYIWTSVPILDINDGLTLDLIYDDHNCANCFPNFMNRVLNLHALSCVRKIRLYIHFEYDENIVEAWITALIKLNVEEFDLRISVFFDFLPPTLFYECQNLVYLKIESYNTVNVSTVYLPRLKTLSLILVFFADDDSTKKFFSGFPVLTDLCMEMKLWVHIYNLNAIPNSLTRLTIQRDIYFYEDPEETCFDNLPMFCNLTHLMVPPSPILLSILKRSPILKSLTLKQISSEDDGWHTPDCVYECFSVHLQNIEFEYFLGFEEEMEMMRYFLKNAMALKRLTINPQPVQFSSRFPDSESMLQDLLKKLHMFPKGSSTCQIALKYCQSYCT